MKKKTALQQLIDEAEMTLHGSQLRWLRTRATELLETEREQIEDSHANGIHDAAECAAGGEFRTSGQYYKDTYQ